MALYPGHPNDTQGSSFGHLIDSTVTIIDPINSSRASNGYIRSQCFGDKIRREFVVNHILTSANRTILLDFYVNTRSSTFEFYSKVEEINYEFCKFSQIPTFEFLGGDLWKATCNIVEL